MKIITAAFFFILLVANTAAGASDPLVSVRYHNDAYIISGVTTVAVSSDIAWETITDLEGIPKFIPIITSSKVEAKDEDSLRLSQTITAYWWAKSVKSLCKIKMERTSVNGTVTFQSVGGDDFKSLVGSYTIEARGDEVRVGMQLAAVPKFWTPPAACSVPMVAKLAEAQLRSLAKEIERRNNINRERLIASPSTPIVSSLQ